MDGGEDSDIEVVPVARNLPDAIPQQVDHYLRDLLAGMSQNNLLGSLTELLRFVGNHNFNKESMQVFDGYLCTFYDKATHNVDELKKSIDAGRDDLEEIFEGTKAGVLRKFDAILNQALQYREDIDRTSFWHRTLVKQFRQVFDLIYINGFNTEQNRLAIDALFAKFRATPAPRESCAYVRMCTLYIEDLHRKNLEQERDAFINETVATVDILRTPGNKYWKKEIQNLVRVVEGIKDNKFQNAEFNKIGNKNQQNSRSHFRSVLNYIELSTEPVQLEMWSMLSRAFVECANAIDFRFTEVDEAMYDEFLAMNAEIETSMYLKLEYIYEKETAYYPGEHLIDNYSIDRMYAHILLADMFSFITIYEEDKLIAKEHVLHALIDVSIPTDHLHAMNDLCECVQKTYEKFIDGDYNDGFVYEVLRNLFRRWNPDRKRKTDAYRQARKIWSKGLQP